MNPLFQKLMGQATRLTSRGDLQRATVAIQEALGAAAFRAPGQRAAHDASANDAVIDVQAREVPASAKPVATATAASRSPARQPEAAPAVPAEGEVLRGTYAGSTGQRDWRLYVPPGDTAAPRPLVVMLHGCTQDPDDFAAGTAMDEAARAQGFYVLYPAQAQSANPQRCWNWFKHNHQQRGKGEPALLAGMTHDVMARHAIDPRRVYVAGLSAGGAMAAILGEAYPDMYAAVGVHSGLAAGAADDLPSALAAMKGDAANGPLSHGLADLPGLETFAQGLAPKKKRAPRAAGRRTPTIVFHGDRDKTVHPVNGEHIVAACTQPAANDEAACTSEECVRSPNGRAYTRRLHADAAGRPLAEHWVVHGAGHAWSGGSARGSYTDAGGPDASTEMLRFFSGHALPER